MLKNPFFCVFLFLLNNLYAQGEVAATYLLIHPSPHLNGMIGAYSALPTDDPFGFYYNPAQIAFLGNENLFAAEFYLSRTEFLPDFSYDDYYFHSFAIAGGYNLSKYSQELPVSFGIGLNYIKLDWGEHIYTDANGVELGSGNSYESCTGFSLGIGYHYLMDIMFGYTYKRLTSNFVYSPSKGNAHDFGLLVVIPVIERFEDLLDRKLRIQKMLPFVNYSVGTALLNYGDEIKGYYFEVGAEHPDPIPRLSKLGHGISLGLREVNYTYPVTWFKFEYAAEAEDILAGWIAGDKISYQTYPGEINIWENIILGRAKNGVDVRHGWNVEILDLFKYSRGKYKPDSAIDRSFESSGFVISSRGLIRILYRYLKKDWLEFLVKNIDIRFTQSKYKNKNPDYYLPFEELRGISVHITNR